MPKNSLRRIESKSGIAESLIPGAALHLDKYGVYESSLPREISPQQSELVEALSIFSEDVPRENEIARELFGNQDGIQPHDVLGQYLALYAGYVVEGQYRGAGSSGGITTWLLTELLANGEVDAVIHVGSAGREDARLFKYTVSTNADEVRSRSKSRYYPAELSEVLRELLSTQQRYAIVAIPTFAAELRLLMKMRTDLQDRIPYVLGLVCGHQKSANYGSAIAFQFGIRPEQIVDIDFRKKDASLGADKYLTEITYSDSDGEQRMLIPSGESSVTDWGKGFFKQEFSDFSDDVFNETADVVLGDAWLPQYQADSKGTNLVVVRNQRILEILHTGVREGRLALETLSPSDALKSQNALVRHNRDELEYRKKRIRSREIQMPATRHWDGSPGFFRRRIQDVRMSNARKSHSLFIDALEKGDWQHFEKGMALNNLAYRWAYRLHRLLDRLSRH